MACGFFEACVSKCLVTVCMDCLVQPTVRHLGYVYRFNKIVKDLRKQSEQLKLKQESVEKDVKEAKNQIQEIDPEVEGWQKDALKVQQDIESLEVKIQENRCCYNWCPNLIRRYLLSKQAEEKSLAISDLMEKKSKFQRVGHPADLPGLKFLPLKEFLPSKSVDLAERQIMEALKDDEVNMIGVWGMGGIGKTTLVNEVGRKAKESKLFEEVVNVVVSQNQNIEKIQDRIVELLNLKLDKETEVGKAELLWLGLQQKKSILIILDDLWKEIDLKAVGIPIGEHHKGCKIVLTTRLKPVCSDMRSGRVVQLGLLDETEAWQLFEMSAELDDKTSPGIVKVAFEVAKECKGLPIAISTLGKALKDASINEWNDAHRKLQSSRLLDIEGVDEEKNAYKCIKFSYDFLRREETKTCFLLCSLYPEDFRIPVKYLVGHAWGLELFQGTKSIQEARDEVFSSMNKLKASSLLIDDGQGCFKMHDMVRDVALWIASKKENHFVIKSEVGASEWPSNGNSGPYTAISLMECKIKDIPKREYPNLELFLFTKDRMETTISEASFEGMKSLKALYLSLNGSLSNDALNFLTNLRTLNLEFCKLNTYSISSLGQLEKLEILSFVGSDVEVLPDEVGNLKTLRLLDLSSCDRLKRIPPNVIQRLSQLEELYFSGCGLEEWLIEGTDAEVKNASLLELNKLSRLAVLVLSVRNLEFFPKNFVFPKLQNYNIAIESDTKEVYPSKRCLKVHRFTSFKAFRNLFEDVELLELDSIASCQNIVPNLDHGGMNSLGILRTRRCKDMECLTDARNQHVPVAFSNLSVLEIEYMNCFEQLCNGPPPNGFLKRLESLKIAGCHKVKSLFPSSVMQSLLQLKSLHIVGCNMLEQIFEGIEGANEVLQRLQSLKISHCGSLESLFPSSVAQNLMQLESVEINDCIMLEQIFEQMEGADGEILSTTQVQPPYLLPRLETLEIRGCNLECLVDTRKQHLPGIALSNLEKLVLEDMTCLKWVCNGESPQGFLQKLQQLKIRRCSGMTSLFPSSFAQYLVHLKELEIVGCHMLERLVMEADFEMSPNNRDLISPCLQELNSLQISYCSRLEYILPCFLGENLPQLKKLSLEYLKQLKEVVGPRQGRDGNDVLLKLPSLEDLHLHDCPHLRPFGAVSFSSQKKIISIISVGESNPVVPQSKENSPNMEYAVIGNAEAIFQLQGGNILSNLWRFQVAFLPELRVIWRSPNQLVTLQNLEEMRLEDCKRLRYVFSPMLARNLPRLRSLRIVGCEELEQIVDTSSSSSQDPDLQTLSFPNLTSIDIIRCNNLKYVFLISILCDLQQLEKIFISEASKLEQVFFGFRDKADAKDHYHQEEERMQLPQLKDLHFEELPSLISFGSVDNHIVFPALTDLWVINCPQMTATFTTGSRLVRPRPVQMKLYQQIRDSFEDEESMRPRGSSIDWKKWRS